MELVPGNVLIGLCCVIGGYLFGSIPNGIIIGKVFFKKDPRDYGSHNSGGTNVGRVFGKKAGVAAIILDMLKIIVPFYAAWALLLFTGLFDYMGAVGSKLGRWYVFDNFGQGAAPLYYWLVPCFGILGHCRSIFLGFKGGKAVASLLGINFAVSWAFFGLGAGSFAVTFFKSRMVSLSSLISAFAIFLASWILAIVSFFNVWNPAILSWGFGAPSSPFLGFEFAMVNTVGFAIVVVRHRENILRIIRGDESKNPWSKGESK